MPATFLVWPACLLSRTSGLKKGVLTVPSPGCTAFGHPARPLRDRPHAEADTVGAPGQLSGPFADVLVEQPDCPRGASPARRRVASRQRQKPRPRSRCRCYGPEVMAKLRLKIRLPRQRAAFAPACPAASALAPASATNTRLIISTRNQATRALRRPPPPLRL